MLVLMEMEIMVIDFSSTNAALDIATSIVGRIANTEYRRTPYRFSDF